jgi:hypothetical protein
MAASDWKTLYESAVLETNNEVLAQRLVAAQEAITARLRELNLDHGGTPEEQQQIHAALKALDTLRSERLAR